MGGKGNINMATCPDFQLKLPFWTRAKNILLAWFELKSKMSFQSKKEKKKKTLSDFCTNLNAFYKLL